MRTETVYCVKYALTTGITWVLGYETLSGCFMRIEDECFQSLTKHEWARDGSKALELAAVLLAKKIKSIEKKRNSLLQMRFELPPKLEVVDAADAHPKLEVVGAKSGRLPG